MRTAPIDTTGWPPEARQYTERLQATIERDRSEVARGLTAARKAVVAREWLRLGRGSYEYNDDRWRDEFGAAIDEIEGALAPLRRVAANLNDSPQTVEAVAAARAALLTDEGPYRVSGDEDGCERCAHGRTWCVLCPDGTMIGITSEDQEHMEEIAGFLNQGYREGRGDAGVLWQLVADLSDGLADEGADWSEEGLRALRVWVANAVPLDLLPDWLRPYRDPAVVRS